MPFVLQFCNNPKTLANKQDVLIIRTVVIRAFSKADFSGRVEVLGYCFICYKDIIGNRTQLTE